MKIDLTETTSSKINAALVQARRDIGTPAIGMVLTLVIVTDEENAYDALKSANDASHEHPRGSSSWSSGSAAPRAAAATPGSTRRSASGRTPAPGRR